MKRRAMLGKAAIREQLAMSDKRTRNLARAALSLAIALWMTACGTPESDKATGDEDKLQVVATSTAIADLTARVGGDEIDLTGLLKPGDDPHVYEPVPRDSVKLEEAEIIFYNGYNLEPNLIKLIRATGISAEKVAVAEVVPPLDFDYNGDRAPDPHVWGDAENGIKMVEAIRDALMKIAPEDGAEFEKNAAELIAELERLDVWITQQIASIPSDRRRLVTTHDAFQYYARAYGLEVTGTLIGISTEEQPSAQTVKNLAESIKQSRVPAIFAETTINPALIATVAEEAGVKIASRELYSDSLGPAGSEGDSYVKMLAANTKAIVEALGGEYVAFEASAE